MSAKKSGFWNSGCGFWVCFLLVIALAFSAVQIYTRACYYPDPSVTADPSVTPTPRATVYQSEYYYYSELHDMLREMESLVYSYYDKYDEATAQRLPDWKYAANSAYDILSDICSTVDDALMYLDELYYYPDDD